MSNSKSAATYHAPRWTDGVAEVELYRNGILIAVLSFPQRWHARAFVWLIKQSTALSITARYVS